MKTILLSILSITMMMGTLQAQEKSNRELRHERKMEKIHAKAKRDSLTHVAELKRIAGDTIPKSEVNVGVSGGFWNGLLNPYYNNGFYNNRLYNNGFYNNGFYNNGFYRNNRRVIIKKRRSNGTNRTYNTPIRRRTRNRISPHVRSNARAKNKITRKKVQTRTRPTQTKRRRRN